MHSLRKALLRAAVALCLLLGFATPLAGQSHTRYATTALRLRAQPTTQAATLRTLPRGAAVAVSTCAGNWCRVEYRGRSGYAAEGYLVRSRPLVRTGARGTPRRPGRGYINSRGQLVPSPRYSPNGPPAGASAQCRDGTYSFSRSRRGTCSHHGGVARWL
jgi:uncharacterized protein YgiM (DUF1202 family)